MRSLALVLLLAPSSLITCSDDDHHGIDLLENEQIDPSSPDHGSEVSACDAAQSCAPPTPYCLAATCVACLTDENCGNGVCTEVHECVDCADDGDCSSSKPYCSSNRCVECITDGNCPDPGTACSPADGKCEVRCSSDEDCGSSKPYCSPLAQVCAQCARDADCATEKPLCNAGKCIECIADRDCNEATPICSTDKNQCVECLSADDCEGATGCDKFKCVE